MNTATDLELLSSLEEFSDYIEEINTDKEDGEYVRLKEELDEGIAALESLMECNGISRSMAVTFENYIPEGYPLNSFSRMPSRTNFLPVVASMEERNWGIISAIAVIIIGIITKIIAWFMGRKDKESMDSTAETFKKNNKILDNILKAGGIDPSLNKKFNDEYKDKWTELDVRFSKSGKDLIFKSILELTEVMYVELSQQMRALTDQIVTIIKDNKVQEVSAIDGGIAKINSTLQKANNSFPGAYQIKGEVNLTTFLEVIDKMHQKNLDDHKKLAPGKFNITEIILESRRYNGLILEKHADKKFFGDEEFGEKEKNCATNLTHIKNQQKVISESEGNQSKDTKNVKEGEEAITAYVKNIIKYEHARKLIINEVNKYKNIHTDYTKQAYATSKPS